MNTKELDRLSEILLSDAKAEETLALMQTTMRKTLLEKMSPEEIEFFIANNLNDSNQMKAFAARMIGYLYRGEM